MKNKDLLVEGNDVLKRILLSMNYDSNKTLSENQKNVKPLNENLQLINEDKTSINYGLVLKTPTNKQLPPVVTIKKGSEITNVGGGVTLIDTENTRFYYNCSGKTFRADSKSSVPLIKNMWNNSIWSSAEPGLTKFLDSKYCSVKSGTGGEGNKPGTTKSTSNVPYDTHWELLFKQLQSLGVNPRYTTDYEKGIKGAPYFWFGGFVINRYGKPFVYWGKDKKYKGVIKDGGKYAGQELKNVMLNTNIDGSSEISLAAFVQSNFGDKNVVDNNKNDKPGGGGNSGGGNSGVRTPFSWKNCSGTYSYGCKSPEVGQAQRCMGIFVDDKFGNKTLRTLKARFGKTSFTDDFLKNTICKTKLGGGGGADLPDEDFSEKETVVDTTWTGDVY